MERNPKTSGETAGSGEAAEPRADQPGWRNRPLVLVGLMGVGKSTIGRRLAARLQVPFADADDEIERAAGMRIAEIFERFGEDYFRSGERRVIERLLSSKPMVLATGGGAFIQDETRALILSKSTAIWLDANIPILAERVGRRGHRPLLVGKDPFTVLTELAARRNPIYAQAPIRVISNESPHEKTVERIMESLSQWTG